MLIPFFSQKRGLALLSAACLFVLYITPMPFIIVAGLDKAFQIDTLDGEVLVGVWLVLSLLALPAYVAAAAFLRYRARRPRADVLLRWSGTIAITLTPFVLLYFLSAVLRGDGQGGWQALVSGAVAIVLVIAGTHTLTVPKQ